MAKAATWTGLAGDLQWGDPDNWSGRRIPASGVNTIFDTGGTVFVLLPPGGSMPAEAGELEVESGSLLLEGGELALSPTPAKSGPTVDLSLTSGASLTLLGGASLLGDETMWIGSDGSGASMTVEGTVEENYAIVHGGELAITGAGRWIAGASGIDVGGAGEGQLLVESCGRVTGGPDGFLNYAASLEIGDPFGRGSAEVTGTGSFLKLTSVYVGEGYDGSLTIADGGVVIDRVGVVAPQGDGYVVIDGAGSRWENESHLSFGSAVPTNSSITVTNSGELDWHGGFGLSDLLRIDGSAILGGKAIFDGGETVALAGEGNVTVSQHIDITYNWLFQDQELAAFSSNAGAKLTLSGKISGDANSILYIGAGDVEASGANNAYGLTEIYAATVEVGADHALGRGEIDFVGGAHAAKLLVDVGVTLGNKIANFGASDSIDLAGLEYSSFIQSSWKAGATGGGALTLISNGFSAVLKFTDSFAAPSFALSSDGGAGTLVKLA